MLDLQFDNLQIGPTRNRRATATVVFNTAKVLIERKLGQLKELTADELKVIDGIVSHRRQCPPGTVLLGESASFNSSRILLNGWCCQQVILANGRRQIVSFLLPGDILAPDDGPSTFGSIVALTSAVTAHLPPFDDERDHHEIGVFATVLNSWKLEREKLLRQQILRLGSMNALGRTGHLLLELCARLANVGLFDGHYMPLPVTQETLGDALGMTPVHVNRIFRQLRRDSLVQHVARNLLWLDIKKLQNLNGENRLLER